MSRNLFSVFLIVVLTAVLAVWMLQSPVPVHESDEHEHEHGHDDDEISKGPHGGRLLIEGDFGLELTLYETGLPPEFHVYAYHDGQPVPPDQVSLELELTRLGNKVDHVRFTPQQDYLRSNTVVHEPHSFEVAAKASYADKAYTWHYDNYEGRTVIPDTMAAEMGIRTETVGPVSLKETRTLTGRIQTNPNRLSRVRPRFPGVITQIHRELGDVVAAGDPLATVQSNESLQNYQVMAPIGGLIVKRDLQVGEATGTEPLFVIADLSDVWVELDVFARDLDLVKKGQPVMVETLDESYRQTSSIDWVSPLTAHASQSVQARATLSNADGLLRPGQFVRGHVTLAEQSVPLAVRQSALQTFRDTQVVFARFDDTYEVRMLELGRQNHGWAEVLDGIDPGTRYVTHNSYLIKADIEKSGASHEH